MIVTATACLAQRVFDIMRVKRSCVIADVARPLDLPASEVAKRPDVLAIRDLSVRQDKPGAPSG